MMRAAEEDSSDDAITNTLELFTYTRAHVVLKFHLA